MEFKKNSKPRPAINVTSLIDVLFILLIFFMVSSTFKEQPGLKLELPTAKSSEISEVKDLVLYVSARQELFLNDQPITEEVLVERMKTEAQQSDPPVFILQADTNVSHGFVVHLIDLVRDTGLRKFSIATEVPEAKKP